MPDLWTRLRDALAAKPCPPPVEADPPTLTLAGEEWEQYEPGCWHRVEGNPQCHSVKLLVMHAEMLMWVRAMDLVRGEAEELSRRGGSVPAEWVAARLRNIADFGAAEPGDAGS